MEVQVLRHLPEAYRTKKPRVYETRFVYTGMSHYDTERKVSVRIEVKNDKWIVHERPCPDTVFSRGYHTELVRVSVYSEQPRVWVEELSPHDLYFFAEVQQPQHVA
jgi:hypothetical protein